MSNIDAVNALITAIHFDRFAEIEALHNPDVTFNSFCSPTITGSVGVEDWQRAFLTDYADCNYADIEYIEDGDTVVVRATLEAKGYDWRLFTQRVVEVFTFAEGGIQERRLYAMIPDLELDKASTAAMANALGYRGGSPAESRKVFEGLMAEFLGGDWPAVKSFFSDQMAAIDGVFGLAAGFDNMMALAKARPRPAFGAERATATYFGDHDILSERAIDPSHPRRAEWYRLVDGKVSVVEIYWMLREIGVAPVARKRQPRQATYPI
jgi:hypothetical protein